MFKSDILVGQLTEVRFFPPVTKVLAWESGGVKFWTNHMSGNQLAPTWPPPPPPRRSRPSCPSWCCPAGSCSPPLFGCCSCSRCRTPPPLRRWWATWPGKARCLGQRSLCTWWQKWPSPLDISIHPTYLLSSRLMLRTLESGLVSSSTGLGGAAAGLPGGSSRKPGLVEVKQVRLALMLILMLIMMLWFDVDVDVDFDVDVDVDFEVEVEVESGPGRGQAGQVGAWKNLIIPMVRMTART